MRVANGKKRKVWFDISEFSDDETKKTLTVLSSDGVYNGIVLGPQQLQHVQAMNPSCSLVLKIKDSNALKLLENNVANEQLIHSNELIFYSDDEECLSKLRTVNRNGLAKRYSVVDSSSLLESISNPNQYDFIVLKFNDPTNIPLELVLASLQGNHTKIIKEISAKEFTDDAIVCFGVMEHGTDGVIYSPKDLDCLKTFIEAYHQYFTPLEPLGLERCTVTESAYIGMGHRACVDLVTLFNPREGLLIGSTSYGGILCCPEVFDLPYMELRPFRVNAGGIHSYLFHHDESTNYLSELKAGKCVTVVNHEGFLRKALVGRIKIEIRPLRLIKGRLDSGNEINVILQDDWHVRVFSETGEPVNVSMIQKGDKLMGFSSTPGRHVGIKISETIKEQ